MAITDARLSIVTFPQRWDGTRIFYRALVLPKGDPQSSLLAGAPAFAGAAVRLRARVIPGLDKLPDAADALTPTAGAQILNTPANAADVFDELAAAFSIDPALTGNPRPPVTFKKYLTRSYRNAFAFEGPSRPYLYTGDAYECALKDPAITNRPPRPKPTGVLSWGQALAFALRQPVLAEALGLMFEGSVTIDAPEDFNAGGWLYVELAPSSAFAPETTATPGSLALFAARLPSLADPRALFASVVFPVGATGTFDEHFVEAESYDDGFAKVVHGAQPESSAIVETQARPAPVVKDLGVQLGWDDEQIAVWMNRQIDPASIAPMGVAGYRVDVKNGDGEWISLTRARGNISVGDLQLGVFDDELTVEVAPLQLAAQTVGDYWLPSYFTTWRGESLVLRGETALRLAGRDDEALAARPFTVPNLAEIPDLRYGRDYHFRVRLVDLSRGGPGLEDGPRNPAPSPEATIKFRRYCPPKAARIEHHPNQEDDEPLTQVRVRRPLLGYPDAVFAGAEDAEAALIDDIEAAGLAEREAGVPDPDVEQLRITVEVRRPEPGPGRGNGNDGYVPIYTTTRAFDGDPDEPLDLTIAYVDHHTLAALEAADPLNPVAAVGDVEVPTARDVRLRLTCVCKEDDDLKYFGTQKARRSLSPAYVSMRAESSDERGLFVADAATDHIRALMMRPDAAPSANHAATRMADRLELQVSNLTFTGRRGRRTVFGCSGSLRHTLAPDRSAITFASSSDLIRQWVVAIRVSLDRDWSWDALAPVSFEVERDGQVVGSIEMPSVVSALAAGSDRNQTDLVFFHAIDPKPRPGQFPAEIHTRFSVRPLFREAPAQSDGPLSWQLRLPIPTPPAQTPKLVSAGIAFSPYDVLPEYAGSTIRDRMLWLEFEEPPLDPQDRYVCRVLAYAPDPALTHESLAIPEPAEPPLPIDQELIRVIVPGQSKDEAGANAMRPLLTAPEGSGAGSGVANVATFLLPRPDGVGADSAELFGFWVYELRLAHGDDRWSLAQARHGARLRVTGVQHPAPPLSCHVQQTADGVMVDVPYATPVFEGRNVRPRTPKTEIWALLYAQGMQVDGEMRRNVLIGRGRGEPLSMPPRQDQWHGDDLLLTAAVRFPRDTVRRRLASLGLPVSAPLSVLAVELLPQPIQEVRYPDPLGGDLGQVRILRASPLQPVPAIC